VPKDWKVGLGVIGDDFFSILLKIPGLGDSSGHSLRCLASWPSQLYWCVAVAPGLYTVSSLFLVRDYTFVF
jgi:hypothetical protein